MADAIEIAKERYDASIDVVVSDNASTMVLMGKLILQFHSRCHAHIANLLMETIGKKKKDLLDKILYVLKEFHKAVLEIEVLRLQGKKSYLPGETRWCGHRDSLVCYRNNLNIYKAICVNGEFSVDQKVKQIVNVFGLSSERKWSRVSGILLKIFLKELSEFAQNDHHDPSIHSSIGEDFL